MNKNVVYTIEQNRNIARDVFFMRLLGPTNMITNPGQFINIQLDGFYLRRPISICDWSHKGVDIIYKVLGKGTAKMATLQAGEMLDVLSGLGNGFVIEPAVGEKPVLVGGGVGTPPLYGLAKDLIEQGTTPVVVLGARSNDDLFYEDEFAALGCDVKVATEDGSAGTKGFVTAILEDLNYNYYFTCGPEGMLKAVHALGESKNAKGQLSFEERMGCGFGACMGCSCQTLVGAKRVCIDGPVFRSGEVSFND